MNLYQFYQHDLSIYTGQKPSATGLFGQSQYLDLYWAESQRHPLLCWLDDVPAGFVLFKERAPGSWSLDEFFIAKPYRRQGLGRRLANELFDTYQGRWEVCQIDANLPAIAFWRATIAAYTSGDYSECRSESQPKGPKQVFRSRARARSP